MRYQNFIGIDPDIEKSGVAFYNSESGKIELTNLTYFQLFDYLKFCKPINEPFLVMIEKGEENKALFSARNSKSKSISASIGMRTGKNFEVTHKIIEMCEYLDIDYNIYVPKTAKWNAKFVKGAYGIIGRTNQDNRDALRCISQFIIKRKITV